MPKRALDLKRLRRLPVPERLQAVEELWGSIASERPELAVPLTPAMTLELDRRLAEHEADPTSAIPWESVHAELLATLRRRQP
jgi:putative addiction module component (TIGR02574 family)